MCRVRLDDGGGSGAWVAALIHCMWVCVFEQRLDQFVVIYIRVAFCTFCTDATTLTHYCSTFTEFVIGPQSPCR